MKIRVIKEIMRILGLSFDTFDAAAAIMVDGITFAAAKEERFSRIEHDPSLPTNAISFCLERAGIKAEELDAVIHYENPLVKFDGFVRGAIKSFPRRNGAFINSLASWLRYRKFHVRARIAKALSIEEATIHYSSHHLSQPASAYYCSPFDKATAINLDSIGEYETSSIHAGEGNGLKTLSVNKAPHSLGLFQSAFATYMGLKPKGDENAFDFLAASGEPEYYDELIKLFRLKSDGRFSIDQGFFEFHCPGGALFRPALVKWLGPAQPPGQSLEPQSKQANIASSVQKCVEDIALRMVSQAVQQTGVSNVCLSGDVFRSASITGRIIRECGFPVYVQPATGDAGGAIGAMAYHYHETLGNPRTGPLRSIHLGNSYSDDEIKTSITESHMDNVDHVPDEKKLLSLTADKLVDEEALVGWFQGRSEWSGAPLGARNILTLLKKTPTENSGAIPALSLIAENVCDYFDAPPPSAPESFMAAAHPLKPEKRQFIPAADRTNGLVRVHAVSRENNPLYHSLLSAIGERTGAPALLTMPLCLKGEPPVETPANALRTLTYGNLDLLILGNHVLRKGIKL